MYIHLGFCDRSATTSTGEILNVTAPFRAFSSSNFRASKRRQRRSRTGRRAGGVAPTSKDTAFRSYTSDRGDRGVPLTPTRLLAGSCVVCTPHSISSSVPIKQYRNGARTAIRPRESVHHGDTEPRGSASRRRRSVEIELRSSEGGGSGSIGVRGRVRCR